MGANYNRIFGFQLFTAWNMYDLLALQPLPGTRWRLFVDYMTARGPALGTEFDFAGKDPFGAPGRYEGMFKAYGIYDTGDDILGGNRGQEVVLGPGNVLPYHHPNGRGRILFQENVQDLFGSFAVPRQYQHRVLFWGVVGAVVLRALFVAVGAAMLARFSWALYVFGGFLLLTGFKLFAAVEEEPHPERNPIFRFLARVIPSTPRYHGQALFVPIAGKKEDEL